MKVLLAWMSNRDVTHELFKNALIIRRDLQNNKKKHFFVVVQFKTN